MKCIVCPTLSPFVPFSLSFFFFKGLFYFPSRQRGRRGRGREKNINAQEIQWSAASCKHADQGLSPQPRRVPWQAIELVTFRLQDGIPTKWARLGRALFFFNLQLRIFFYCYCFLEKEEGKERQREKERCERETSIAYLCRCPSWGSSLQPFGVLTRDRTSNLLVYGTMLQPTEPPGQGSSLFFFFFNFWAIICLA